MRNLNKNKEQKMKTFNTTWNYSLNSIPSIGEKIILDFGNGMGSDRRFPYLVEEIREGKRGDFNIVYVEGRQLKKDGSFKTNWGYLIFTDRPKTHYGWKEGK